MAFADKMAVALSIITPNGSIDLNDHSHYAVSAQSTRENTSTAYRQILATSPALAGQYLVHSVPDLVTETVGIWVLGATQTALQANYNALRAAFESWTYQLAWTWADYSEHWNCNAVTSMTIDMSQGMLHNYMAHVTLTVPRFPTVVTP